MTNDLGAQNCPNPECGARYAAEVIENRDTWACPECGGAVIPCPTCRTIVLIGVVLDRGECPACPTARQAFDDFLSERETGVVDA